MKKIILILFLCLVSFKADALITFFAPGGPNTWYYGSGLTESDFESTANYNPGQNRGDDVTITAGGTITKFKVKHGTTNGGTSAALLITTAAGVKVYCQALIITDQATAWEEFTLSTPITGVSNGTVYHVYLVPGSVTAISHSNVAGGLELNGTFVPADVCAETSYTTNIAYQRAVALYCD